ncbi:zinc-dependent alcohol dehydrogenase [Anaerosolibacter sp.]|uniref:zinc-dependent alcohol dehydrogenase n=1 Tax=Anaerosolibacter sp. TaxID=1872527 RepID=UPI0039F13669
MKALVKKTPYAKDTYLEDIPNPKAGYNQVVVKVDSAGLCGTDIKFYNTDKGKTKLVTPVVIGHEGCGTIVEAGEGVCGLTVGDRIVCETSFYHCGKCVYCMTGYHNMCTNDRTSLGSKVDGFFAQYVLCNADFVHKIPDNITFDEGALMEPLACCVHAVLERSSIKPMDNCIIFGPGPIGILTAQVAKAAGAQVILVGTKHSRERLDLAKKMGIETTIVFDEMNFADQIQMLTDGLGADVIYECSGSNAALNQSLKMIKKLGEIVLMAAPTDCRLNLWDDLVLRDVNIVSSLSSKSTSWRTAIMLVQSKKINLMDLISHRFTIDQWEMAFTLGSSRECMKIMIYPNR